MQHLYHLSCNLGNVAGSTDDIVTGSVIFIGFVRVVFVQVSRIAESLHVLHLQSSLHKQLDGNTRVSDSSRNCSRVANGG